MRVWATEAFLWPKPEDIGPKILTQKGGPFFPTCIPQPTWEDGCPAVNGWFEPLTQQTFLHWLQGGGPN